MKPALQNVNIERYDPIKAPKDLVKEFPLSERARETVKNGREAISAVLESRDRRLLGIVGPCSIHDPEAALDFAHKLKGLKDRIEDKLVLIMRVYFEKPRTSLGWKGLILDPLMDGSNDIQKGLSTARELLCKINDLGLPAAIEALDPIVPQYIDDLVSWAAIGARTTESQTHREMASGLSFPVGFKNGTDGSIETAVNAMASSFSPHSFIGIDIEGKTCIVHTKGNKLGHIILRGGKAGPNYYRERIEETEILLKKAKLPERVLIDCSHGNTNKDYRKQSWVLEETIRNRNRGMGSIKGFMLESNIHEGRQEIPSSGEKPAYGISVTDPCISWEETEAILVKAAQELSP